MSILPSLSYWKRLISYDNGKYSDQICLYDIERGDEPPDTPQVRWLMSQSPQKSVYSLYSLHSCVESINQSINQNSKRKWKKEARPLRDGVSSAQLKSTVCKPTRNFMNAPRCVRGVTKLLSLHQLCCVDRLDSTVKTPHRNQRSSRLLWVWMTDSRGCLWIYTQTFTCQTRKHFKITE